MSQRLHLGISTCPNDTFAFHGLLTGAVDPRGLELEIELADVEALNERLIEGELDAAKASFHAALRASAELARISHQHLLRLRQAAPGCVVEPDPILADQQGQSRCEESKGIPRHGRCATYRGNPWSDPAQRLARHGLAHPRDDAGERSGLVVLPVGAALGFGVGPVLLAGRPRALPDAGAAPEPLVLCPGEWTTAHLLYRRLHPGVGRIEQVVFSEIMPALAEGRADFGVCIHEGRFTWRERGLALVEDLGASWEARTGAPLPLGGILARRSLGKDRIRRLAVAIGDSIDHARAHPAEALVSMRRYAQEERDEVLWAHVDLYVNEWTRELGSVGKRALAALEREARAAGIFPALDGATAQPPLEVLDGRFFHLAPAGAWRAHVEAGSHEWRPASLALEGFVHLSFADQLEGTLRAHFAAESALALVELDPARPGTALRLEAARGGELFPHLYRPLLRTDVARASTIQRGRAGWVSPFLSEP